jgi:hypothetical protein
MRLEYLEEGYFLLAIPPSWQHRTDQIRSWLNAQDSHCTFYPPDWEHDQEGLLYFLEESAATAFLLRWG